MGRGVYGKRRQVQVTQTLDRPRNAPYVYKHPGESQVARLIGEDQLEMAQRISTEQSGAHAIPIPILGSGAFIQDGALRHAVETGTAPREGKTTSIMEIVKQEVLRLEAEDARYARLFQDRRPWVREGLPFLEYVLSLGGRPQVILDEAKRTFVGIISPTTVASAGFSSLSDLINKWTSSVGGQAPLWAYKVGTTKVANRASTLIYATGNPTAASAAAALAGGTAYTSATAGAIGPQNNAPSGTQHVANIIGYTTVVGMPCMLMDSMWAGTPANSNNAAQTVTIGGLNRYSGTGANSTSIGNVVWIECQSSLTGGTGTITVQYKDSNANTAENAPTQTGVAAVSNQFCYNGIMFLPLNTGDLGVSDVTQFTNTTDATAGSFAVRVGHPLAFLPAVAVAGASFFLDGINSAFNLQRVYDNAFLCLLEPPAQTTTATTFGMSITLASG